MTLQQATDTLDIPALLPEGTQLIGGECVPARSGETIPVINPATVRRIEAGQVSINTLWSGGVIAAPFGGYKSSGFGRTVSADSIVDYTQVKSVIIEGRA
jgi:acyl-CoA reductase-like NAD-dependent aldehyde dehydrogenase